ncbi:conserved unknown protein [Ectocarpus siliculosus]|uniref:Protein kinase domain-containing protein n=1 Tax=Ectocarpus siliculosus TaxID=2880 RepID=D8LJW5_ECTSI|nr:conserved unknown protein [Ectocarpus siliculosus]|eukprot:CBN76016.1 conserved unknown protein [Ectocarpus siliculosus]
MCDFGLCRNIAETAGPQPHLTDYVATRWYRAPEILLGSPRYTKGVDMWAVGCILGEMLSGRPTFPGTSTMNQLEKIMESTGRPSPEDVQSIKSPFAGTMLESIPPTRQISLNEVFSSASAQALDLMSQCLQFNPDKGVRAADALKHPYVAEFHNPDDEPDYPHGAIQITIDKGVVDDNTKLSAADYREMLYKDINNRRKEARRAEQARQSSGRATAPVNEKTA